MPVAPGVASGCLASVWRVEWCQRSTCSVENLLSAQPQEWLFGADDVGAQFEGSTSTKSFKGYKADLRASSPLGTFRKVLQVPLCH